MKRKYRFIYVAVLMWTVGMNTSCSSRPQYYWSMTETTVEAPFEMPAIQTPDFSQAPRYSIVDFGAVEGDQAANSKAIADAMAKASPRGGVVVVPDGEWKTGPVHFKSNVNLHLEEGATLLFSAHPDDYLPAVHSSWEGMECYNFSPLIYAYECENVALTGSGTLKAEMEVWETWFPRPQAHMNGLKYLYNKAMAYAPMEERVMVNDSSHLRPQFIQFNRCSHVLLDGLKIRNSPFWTNHFYLCKDVIMRNLDIQAHGHNNDGVDPEMTQNMLIENCVFDQGDDAVALKSGRNPEGWRLKTPTKNVVIRHCTVKNAHQLLAVGTELSGGIENIFLDSCLVMPDAKINHLLFVKTNERMGGYAHNIYVSHIQAGHIDKSMVGIETDVLFQWRDLVPTEIRRLTPIENIFVSDMQAGDVNRICHIYGQEELPVGKVLLENVHADHIRSEDSVLVENAALEIK